MKNNHIIYFLFAAIAIIFAGCRQCVCESNTHEFVGEDTITLAEAQKWIATYDASNAGGHDTTHLFISNKAALRILNQDNGKDIDGIYFNGGIDPKGVLHKLAFAAMHTPDIPTAPLVYVLVQRSCVCVPCCSGSVVPPPVDTTRRGN